MTVTLVIILAVFTVACGLTLVVGSLVELWRRS